MSAVAVAAVAATMLTGAPAAAHGGDTLLRDGFQGNIPLSQGGHAIGGVDPAGRAWVLDDRSRVRVREDGRIRVTIRGLIFADGAPNVVPRVAASLVCGGVDGAVVDSTEPFPLSIPAGHARTSQRIDVPDDCDDPVVLIRNAASPTGLGGYFAFTTDADDD